MKFLKYGPSLIKFLIFAVVTILLTAVLVQAIGQIGVNGPTKTYKARFTDVAALVKGNDVRIAGVKVGSIQDIEVVDDRYAEITFSVTKSVTLRRNTSAEIHYLNLIGGRFLALMPGQGDAAVLPENGEIPLSQTKPALDLTVLFNGFKPLFQALNPADVNRLAFEIVQTLQGEGGTLNELLLHTSSLTNALADRDAVIGSMINNLNTVLATVDQRDNELDQLIAQLQRLFTGLAQDKQAIGDSLVNIDNVTGDLASLLQDARPPLLADVQHLGSVAGTLDQQSQQLAAQLQQQPRTINKAARTATYGSWFNFFLCQADLQLTLPTGQTENLPGIQNNDAVCHSA